VLSFIKETFLLRPWQTRTHCCGHIVAHGVSWAEQIGKQLLRTQNVSEQNQYIFVSATNVARAGKRGNICVGNNVSATMCPRLPGPLFLTFSAWMKRTDKVFGKP